MTFSNPLRRLTTRRYKFAHAKPRIYRGTLRKENPAINPAAAGQRTGRRLNRIGKHWLSKPDIVYRGEREICNPATDVGRAEYKYRTMLMWVRQDSWCCFREYDFCPGGLHLPEEKQSP